MDYTQQPTDSTLCIQLIPLSFLWWFENGLVFLLFTEGKFIFLVISAPKNTDRRQPSETWFLWPVSLLFLQSSLGDNGPYSGRLCLLKNVCSIVLHGVQILIPPQKTVLDFYLAWHDRRPSKYSRAVLHKSWHSIVKITWWTIWLAQNSSIFND